MVNRLCCVVLVIAVSQATRAAELNDQVARWLRGHKFDVVALDDGITSGELGSTFVVATDRIVVVQEKTFLSNRSWTSQMVDALYLAMPHDNLTMKTVRLKNRHVAFFFRSDDAAAATMAETTFDAISAGLEDLRQQKNQIQPEAESPKQ